jgi:ABC-type polysaccharide/polyol phosphate transport system ATPase subunit
MSHSAVKVDSLSKKFSLWHGKESTLKSTAISILKSRKLSKGEFWALKDVGFEIERGKTLGIVGPNGSGKSTLLRILAGIIYPTSGEVTVNGKASTLFELGTGFHPELTGRENIYLNGAILGLRRKEIREKFDEIVEFSELGKFIEMPLKHYSSGMQVRLAFSVAINVNPEILLVDEVLAVGDLSFQDKSFNAFQEFKRKGTTIIFVSHALPRVREFCDQAILLESGEIKASGSPEMVISKYGELAVRREDKRLRRRGFGEGKRWGDGRAKVESLEIMDSQGSKRTVFGSGPLVIKMKSRFYADSDTPIFGITVKNAKGDKIFVTNTMWKGVKTGRFKRGDEAEVTFEIENSFVSGEYSVSPAIAHSNAIEFYDWREKLAVFKIKKSQATDALADFVHKLEVVRTS